ncbi:hypothetical protein, partial [Actinoallomurus acaciae]
RSRAASSWRPRATAHRASDSTHRMPPAPGEAYGVAEGYGAEMGRGAAVDLALGQSSVPRSPPVGGQLGHRALFVAEQVASALFPQSPYRPVPRERHPPQTGVHRPGRDRGVGGRAAEKARTRVPDRTLAALFVLRQRAGRGREGSGRSYRTASGR